MYQQRAEARALDQAQVLGVTIVMPCLNETISLPHCIANAQDALRMIEDRFGLAGEIVIADNGSTDGSQALAESLGARVVAVTRRGYGAALIGGCQAAYGDYILMGDCDGSYNFTEGVAMIGKLIDGNDLCMGSRFDGGIAPGAMPWKNRHIGNPALTGILNLFFRSGINDAHCGLRAISRDAFAKLGLSGEGMEFASEMVIKASLKKMRVVQVPATLSVDLRDRAPHLRPWRDGWRHLRYLLMLSPTWVFGVPAMLAMGIAMALLFSAALHALGILPGTGRFGTSWTIVAGFLFTLGHLSLIMALATHLFGVPSGISAIAARDRSPVEHIDAGGRAGAGFVADGNRRGRLRRHRHPLVGDQLCRARKYPAARPRRGDRRGGSADRAGRFPACDHRRA
jgi:glycosyltransferase involved in cell wall biosynthesis